jgi:hypothetical protein
LNLGDLAPTRWLYGRHWVNWRMETSEEFVPCNLRDMSMLFDEIQRDKLGVTNKKGINGLFI